MVTSHVIGVFFAFTASLIWGAADFSGGVATRRGNQYQVLALASISGLAVLIALGILRSEAVPSVMSSIWASCAGISGALGIAALYRALSLGNAAIASPTAAVIGAALPVLFGILTEGLPSSTRSVGFIVAVFGIWLVSKSQNRSIPVSRKGLVLAVLAGIGFGGFFILIAQVDRESVFAPLAVSKTVSLLVALLILLLRREGLPSVALNPIACLAGVLDAGGNVFYLLARQFTRLDVAAVLASMYASVTVILARMILKEEVSRGQWAGVWLCSLAVALIVL